MFTLPKTSQYLPLQSGSHPFIATPQTSCIPSQQPAALLTSVATLHPMNHLSPASHSPPTPRSPLRPALSNVSIGSSTRLPTQGLVIPNIPIRLADGSHSHKRESWRIIVDHWQRGDPAHGLHTPLRDWPREWLQGANKIFAQKHFDRRIIATEFLET